MVKNIKNGLIIDLDSSKEGFRCTEGSAKDLGFLPSIISES